MRLSIFHKFLFVTLIAAIVPLVIFWAVNRALTQETWRDTANLRLQETADALADKVNDWARTNRQILEQLGRMEAIRAMEPKTQDPLLKTVSDTYDWTYLVFTIAPDGRNVGRNDGRKKMYFGDRAYFQEVVNGEPYGQQVLIGRTSGKPTYVLALPVKSVDNKVAGVVALSAQLKTITEAVGGRRIGETGFAFLLDDQGKVIAHPDTSKALALMDLHSHPAVMKASTSHASRVEFMENGERQIAEVRNVGLGWTLVVQQSYGEAFATVRKTDSYVLYLLVGAILMSLAIAGLAARRLSLPLRALTEASTEISRGRLAVQVPETQRRDEIGELALGVERMAVSVRLLGDRLFKVRDQQHANTSARPASAKVS